MKFSSITNILAFIFFFTITISCNESVIDNSFGTTILDTMSNEKLKSSTRAFLEESEKAKKITFTVIYNGDLEQMSTQKDSKFKLLLDTYGLEITDPFEIDEEHKGIVLVPTTALPLPIEIGKEISLLDEVLMVEVDNVKKDSIS
ncbi:hypothetical protein [Aureispira anguillae]|uniref:Uncharacterized protein n=1 Tax=Aureispira anguillae TaxID=2864201 RepID=A0A916DR93_9BACT|nr:hypothetical protein [Aureispira anguillae]BDS10227.1 hypothetical protein AsAng_0009350 [Aureispira anguillae]